MKKELEYSLFLGRRDFLSEILNDDMIDVTNKIITPCPKEGTILYLIEYEDHREE